MEKAVTVGDRLRHVTEHRKSAWTVVATGRLRGQQAVCLMRESAARGREKRWVTLAGLRYFERVEERRAA